MRLWQKHLSTRDRKISVDVEKEPRRISCDAHNSGLCFVHMRQSNCILTACVFCAYRNSQIPEPITTRIVYISTIITSCPTVVLQYARGKRSDAITVSSIFSFREILSPKNVLFNRGLNNSIVKLGFLWKKSAKSAKRGHWPWKPWLHIAQTIDAYGLTTHRVVSGFAIIEHRLVMFWVWKQAFYTVAIWSGVERTEHPSFHSNRLRTAILIIRIEWNCCCVENSSSVRVDITYVRCIDHELECRLAHIACNFNLHRDGCSTKRLKKKRRLVACFGTNARASVTPTAEQRRVCSVQARLAMRRVADDNVASVIRWWVGDQHRPLLFFSFSFCFCFLSFVLQTHIVRINQANYQWGSLIHIHTCRCR